MFLNAHFLRDICPSLRFRALILIEADTIVVVVDDRDADCPEVSGYRRYRGNYVKPRDEDKYLLP